MSGLEKSLTNGHTLAPKALGDVALSFSDESRDFLRELFQNLAESIQPSSRRWVEEETAFLAAHLGVPEAEQTRIAQRFPVWATNYVLVALDAVLRSAPYQLREVLDFGYGGRCTPTYRSVSVTPEESREVMQEGWYAVVVDNIPLAVSVAEKDCTDGSTRIAISVAVAVVHQELGRTLLKAVEAYPNFYRGQVITIDPSGMPEFQEVPEVALDDVVLEPELWSAIREQVLDFVDMQQAFRAARLPFRRGIILAGPPGVGKTLVFRALTHRLRGRCSVLWLTARSIPEPPAVRRVFELARALAPTLMLWEDVDLTVRDRRAGNTAAVLGELLAQLDGPASSDGVIACASTNDPSVLDEALSTRPSRFDRIVFVGLPSEGSRLRMLRRFVADVPAVDADLAWVARETADLTGADLREVVITAFAEAQREAGDSSAPAALETRHFRTALRQLAEANKAARRSGVRRGPTARRGQFGFSTAD